MLVIFSAYGLGCALFIGHLFHGFFGVRLRGTGIWFFARLVPSRRYSSALAEQAAKRWGNTIHLLKSIRRKGTRLANRFLPLRMATTMRRRSMRQWCEALRFLR